MTYSFTMGSETLDYMLWTVVLVLLYSRFIMAKDHHQNYYTVYACDGKMLKIECKEGYVINLIRANYGRYSITVCNDNGSTDWSVNCMSHRSYQILQSRCSSKRNCSIPASTSLFDDPCHGTVKYLEAHYSCVSATSSSSSARPTPPWLATSPPSVWVTAKSFSVQPDIMIPSTPSAASTSSTVPSTKLQPREREPEENEWIPANTVSPAVEPSSEGEFISPRITNSEVKASSTESLPLAENDRKPMCEAATVRDLLWNVTAGGDVSVQPCPGGASGIARWRCQVIGPNLAIRFPDTPDLSECQSMWIKSLETRITENESLIKIADDLGQVTENKILFGGDIRITVKIIRDLTQNMAKNIQTFPDARQRQAIVFDLLKSVARVGSNMLDVSQQPSWKDLTYKEQMRVATMLLVGLEENSFLLADTMAKEKTEPFCTKNILLSVQVHETKNVVDEIFPTESVVDKCSLRVNNWLKLQRSSLLENSEGGLVRLVYTAFDTLEYILKPQSSDDEVKKINSKVLSASLGQGRHIQLHQPVTLCLQHLQTENVSNPTCVFWDYTLNDWSKEGCSRVSTNLTHTICSCNHLTNFAILVDVKPTYSAGQVSLPMLTFLVVVLVVCAVVVAVLVFRYVRKHNARKDYGATFVQESEWFTKCFGCCQSPSESEKTLNCKEPRPALYGNPTMQSMASVADGHDGATICATHMAHPSNTIPRSYMNDNGIESHYPSGHVKLNHHNYPTYNRNGSIRKIKEARRLEHLENTLQHRNKKLAAGTLRSNSPRSHTYSEIAAGSSRSDPVYEEIEREREHCSQISDVSDEDAKRNSDMSRQSSKSYGDHRPLIPYNPVTDRSFHAALDAAYRQQLKEHSARTVSVLDGQTVICHLQQTEPRIYHKSVSHSPHHY